MPINTRTEYALRALLELVSSGTEAISAQTICRRQQLPKKYVEHLLSALKNAGLIESSIGSRGGYTLSRKADQITLLDVMNAVDDQSSFMDCLQDRGGYCLGQKCTLNPFFGMLSLQQRELYDSYSLSTIADFHTQGV